jgi:hypothetical protein
MISIRRTTSIFLEVTLLVWISCIPVAGLHVWNVNDPDSCPLEAEIGEPIIIIGDPPSAERYITDPYNATGEQKQLVSELWGSEITMGEFLRIVYPHLWDGLSPEEQLMYDSYMKAWEDLDPVPLPPWHEPGETVVSSTGSSNSFMEYRLETRGYALLRLLETVSGDGEMIDGGMSEEGLEMSDFTCLSRIEEFSSSCSSVGDSSRGADFSDRGSFRSLPGTIVPEKSLSSIRDVPTVPAITGSR